MFDTRTIILALGLHLLKAAIAVAIAVAVWMFGGERIAAIASSIVEKRTLIFVSERRADTIERLRADLSRAGGRESALRALFPPVSDILPFVSALEAANTAAYREQRIGFGDPSQAGEVFHIPFTISARGTIDDLVAHMGAVEALPYLAYISSFSIQSAGGSWKNISDISLSGGFYAQ